MIKKLPKSAVGGAPRRSARITAIASINAEDKHAMVRTELSANAHDLSDDELVTIGVRLEPLVNEILAMAKAGVSPNELRKRARRDRDFADALKVAIAIRVMAMPK